MNLIPESNGLKKVNMRKKLTTKEWVKLITTVVLGIFIVGFLFQILTDFIGNESVSTRLNYAKVDTKRMEYKLSGSGDYTIVFDGALGANLYEWESITEKIESDLGVKTFVYNRRGYGFNENIEGEDPSKQAENLKILLRKAGVSGKLIFVGEEYGSLVMTNFAKEYPDSVSGLLLIKPFDEEIMKTKEFKKEIKWKYYKSNIEKIGTSFSLTRILDGIGIATKVDGFEENLSEASMDEFKVHKNQKSYRSAVSSELENLYNYTDESQINGLVSGKPLYIITNDENTSLTKLGNEELTTVYVTESESNIMSMSDEDTIINGISSVLKEAKKIAKKAKISQS